MTRYLANGCECPDIVTGTGGKRPKEPCEHGNRFQTEAELRSAWQGSVTGPSTAASEEQLLAPGPKAPRRRKPLKRGNGFQTSPEQKRATKGRACIVCGRDEAEVTIDPAHVTPRRMAPHCTCEKGTVPLCRRCHETYDQLGGGFDLLPYLMAHGLLEETVHGFLEHGVSLREVLDVVTGLKWAPVEKAAPSAYVESLAR